MFGEQTPENAQANVQNIVALVVSRSIWLSHPLVAHQPYVALYKLI